MKFKTLEEAEEHIRELDSTICSLVSKLKKLEEENAELKLTVDDLSEEIKMLCYDVL